LVEIEAIKTKNTKGLVMKEKFGTVWQAVPAPLRKTIVLVIGLSIVTLGLALIVLPGPFTIPLLILGFFILGSEFAWAATVLTHTRRQMDRAGNAVKRVVRRNNNSEK
jgi:hypothetical protein